MYQLSPLQHARLHFQPKIPKTLQSIQNIILKEQHDISRKEDNPDIYQLFPKLSQHAQLVFQQGSPVPSLPQIVGVVLSGGQAPGGHNVIAGLFDALKTLNPDSRLYGFLNGPIGIINNRYMEITDKVLASYRNQGGFDLIGAGRDKIETDGQLEAAVNTVKELKLNGLVIVGGDDSNTNAAILAHYFISHDISTTVVGVPKTIDGDLKNEDIEISFGFDTATKVYSAIIGDIMRDTLSAKKSYYFIKMMGRSASHIALECALQTHPNLCLIGEEIALEKRTLRSIVNEICDLIVSRSAQGKEYGVFLIPEGLIEFIPEVNVLIQELNILLSNGKLHANALDAILEVSGKQSYIAKLLTEASKACLDNLPLAISAQLLIARDPHGNVQVSKIETERLFIEMVSAELNSRQKKGQYSGKFSSQPYFCGYEGRSSLPSNFDSQYCYALGMGAAVLVKSKANGFMACIKGLTKEVADWQPVGIPLISMMTTEQRHGVAKPVIKKALVDLQGIPFAAFSSKRHAWAMDDDYTGPGPIQFFGPAELTDGITKTLMLESKISSVCDFAT